MRIAFDIDQRLVVDPDDLTTAVTSLRVRRGEVIPISVQLCRDGVVTEEEEGAEVEIYLTEADDFTTLVASEIAITGTGTGIETTFSGDLDMDETAVDGLFSTGAVKSAETTLEIRLTTASHSYRSAPVLLTVQNSYTAPAP